MNAGPRAAGMPCNEKGLLVHVRGRELVDEPGGGEIGTIGRQKCGKVRDYDREPRCGRGKEESWRKSFSEEGLSDCVLKTWDNIL